MGLKFIIANKLFLIKKKKKLFAIFFNTILYFHVTDAEHLLCLTRSVLGFLTVKTHDIWNMSTLKLFTVYSSYKPTYKLNRNQVLVYDRNSCSLFH